MTLKNLLLAGALGLSVAVASAQTGFPSKPIRLVVGFPAARAPDLLARLFADKAQFGQPVVVDNVPGAGGNIGAAETVPGFEATTWFAVFAPAGTPKDVVARIHAEMVRVFKLPEVADKLKTIGLEPWISTPDELARYQASEIVKWAKVVKDSGAKAE